MVIVLTSLEMVQRCDVVVYSPLLQRSVLIFTKEGKRGGKSGRYSQLELTESPRLPWWRLNLQVSMCTTYTRT